MAKALFSTSHRDVYNLFRCWGWLDGPERGDGHKRMVWPETGQQVQIAPPDRPGTCELGNSIGIKDAIGIMGITEDQFFRGFEIRKEQRRAERMARAEHEYQRREDRVAAQAALAAAEAAAVPKQEDEMSRVPKGSVSYGITEKIRETLRAGHGVPYTIHEIAVLTLPAEGITVGDWEKKVQAAVSQIAKVNRHVERVGRGKYVWLDESSERNVPDGKVIGTVPVPQPSLNGSTPELLSRVAVLDGGKYLFQGDDSKLYVISELRALDV